MSNLQSLYLDDNQLLSLPPEIGQLKKLHWLHLDGNPISALPLEIGQLSQLYTLTTPPMTFPPLEIQQLGTKATVAYLRDYEAMLVRQMIASIAAGVGAVTGVTLALRWRQRRGLGEKKKRL